MRKRGIVLAIASFLIGTAFFITFLITRNADIAVYGFFYALFAILPNLVSLEILISESIKHKKFSEYKLPIFLILLNIPIAIVYAYFGGQMLNRR
jgi:hypothetical protein